jgi:hypothetical protein
MSGKCYRPQYNEALEYCDASQQTSAAPVVYTQAHGNAAAQEAARATTTANTNPRTFSHGRKPTADNPGPHAYIENNGQHFTTGAGLYSNDNLQMMSARMTMGNNYGGNGERRSGVRADAQMFKGQTNSDGLINGEMSVFDASAQIDAGQDGATVGASANVITGGVTLGNKIPSAQNNMDTSGRAAVGFGLGAAGRGHWGDKDNDGVPEVGIGADIGPVSFDVKSEAAGHYSNFVGDQWADVAGHPGGMRAYHTSSNSEKRDAARPPAAMQWVWRNLGF